VDINPSFAIFTADVCLALRSQVPRKRQPDRHAPAFACLSLPCGVRLQTLAVADASLPTTLYFHPRLAHARTEAIARNPVVIWPEVGFHQEWHSAEHFGREDGLGKSAAK
jgi:hypothetical protein